MCVIRTSCFIALLFTSNRSCRRSNPSIYLGRTLGTRMCCSLSRLDAGTALPAREFWQRRSTWTRKILAARVRCRRDRPNDPGSTDGEALVFLLFFSSTKCGGSGTLSLTLARRLFCAVNWHYWCDPAYFFPSTGDQRLRVPKRDQGLAENNLEPLHLDNANRSPETLLPALHRPGGPGLRTATARSAGCWRQRCSPLAAQSGGMAG